jgi:formylglycine-generating enzyme required for sulfatase activity
MYLYYLTRPVLSLLVALTLISCADDKTEDEQMEPPYGGMVLVTSGGKSFVMGSQVGGADELPLHSVSFTADFWMDETEVTQLEYDRLMSEAYSDYITTDWHEPYGLGDEYPAYSLYWGDAVLYCNARSRASGLDSVYTYSEILGTPGGLCELVDPVTDFSADGFRLPTEAEWEYACRAGSSHDFYWDRDHDPYPATEADSSEIDTQAIWWSNSWSLGVDDPLFGAYPVASRTANGYGLYDMAGNLYEWCHDWYGPYGSEDVTDPTGAASGSWHTVRGGSWGNDVYYLRSSNRTFHVPDYAYYFIGFRAVASAE